MSFPQHSIYTKNSILPNNHTRQQLDQQTIDFYHQWKARYVKQSCMPGQNYIWFERPGKRSA